MSIFSGQYHSKHHLNKTGIAKQPGGHDYAEDDVLVWFDDGDSSGYFGYFKEHELKKFSRLFQ